MSFSTRDSTVVCLGPPISVRCLGRELLYKVYNKLVPMCYVSRLLAWILCINWIYTNLKIHSAQLGHCYGPASATNNPATPKMTENLHVTTRFWAITVTQNFQLDAPESMMWKLFSSCRIACLFSLDHEIKSLSQGLQDLSIRMLFLGHWPEFARRSFAPPTGICLPSHPMPDQNRQRPHIDLLWHRTI